MGRRVLEAVAALGALALAGLLLAVLAGPPARAGALPGQLLGSSTVPGTAHPSTSVTSPRSVTLPSTTAVRTTATSAPSRTTVTVATSSTTVVHGPAPAAPAPGNTTYPTSEPVTTPAPTTTTTIAPLGGGLPVSPATLPLRTRGTNAHVNPVFAILSGIGFLVALLIVAGRLFVTRPGGPDQRPLGVGDQPPASRSS